MSNRPSPILWLNKAKLPLLFVLVALALPASASATTGSITNASYDPATSTVRVSNMRVSFTGCGNDGTFTVYCGAIAGVASPGVACPPGGESQSLPVGLRPLWDFGYTLTDGTVDSGFRSAAVPAPAVYRVCLYAKGYEQNGTFGGSYLLDDADTQALPPQPSPLTAAQAKRAAKRALGVRYGKRYRNGDRKHLRCVEKKANVFRCPTRWVHRDHRYQGTVAVRGPKGSIRTRVRVSRRTIK